VGLFTLRVDAKLILNEANDDENATGFELILTKALDQNELL
jgi:hypothetical protein